MLTALAEVRSELSEASQTIGVGKLTNPVVQVGTSGGATSSKTKTSSSVSQQSGGHVDIFELDQCTEGDCFPLNVKRKTSSHLLALQL